jgi:hypothetical protein
VLKNPRGRKDHGEVFERPPMLRYFDLSVRGNVVTLCKVSAPFMTLSLPLHIPGMKGSPIRRARGPTQAIASGTLHCTVRLVA